MCCIHVLDAPATFVIHVSRLCIYIGLRLYYKCLTYNHNRTCATQRVNHVACICNVDVRNPMHVVCWAATVLHVAADGRYAYTDVCIYNHTPHIANSCTFNVTVVRVHATCVGARCMFMTCGMCV